MTFAFLGDSSHTGTTLLARPFPREKKGVVSVILGLNVQAGTTLMPLGVFCFAQKVIEEVIMYIVELNVCICNC